MKAQRVWSKYYVPGFKFFIGISGKFFKRGLPEEQSGDERMISPGIDQYLLTITIEVELVYCNIVRPLL